MRKGVIFGLFAMALLIVVGSCNKGSLNPNIPNVVINVTIDPNSTIFQELNTAGGGWTKCPEW